MNLQPTAVSYTISERARIIYDVAIDICDFDKACDVYTPNKLIQPQVVDILPQHTVCVPGAGIGSYIVALLEKGVKPENIVAVELDLRFGEIGEGIFSRFGVRYVLGDFLQWEPNMRFDFVIGNPPYGKNASLAVKFLNKAAELTNDIRYVLPRSFRKPSILNRINRNLHLTYDEDTPDETFGGKIITCYQKWEVRGNMRELIKTQTTHPDFRFVKREEGEMFIGRAGAGPSGKVLTENFKHYATSHFFIVPENEEVKQRLISLEPDFRKAARASVVGMPNLSKNELISIYVDTFG
jgi:predicted RNA methylase